jgi:hypothetical protein
MNGPGNASSSRRTHRRQTLQVPPATGSAAHQDQDEIDNESLMESLWMTYADIGFSGVVIMIMLSPLLMTIFLVGALWELNMCMGNINPPWYKLYMEFFKAWWAAAIELVLPHFITGLEAVCRFFNRALLMKLLLTIPLCTVVLHGSSILRGESGLFATLAAHDLIYFVIHVVARGVGGFDHSKMVIFLLVEVIFSIGRVGLEDGT